MAILRGIKDAMLRTQRETEINVATGDFSNLTIRAADGFHYFFDSSSNRLIKTFLLYEGPQVDTMCNVVLVDTDDGLSPRLRFWKRDKTVGKTAEAIYQSLKEADEPLLVKASVDLDDSEDTVWKLFDFLRSCEGICLPPETYAVPVITDPSLTRILQGHEKNEVLAAVKLHLGNNLTDKDVQLLVDRRGALEQFERLLYDRAFFKEEQSRIAKSRPEALWQFFFESNPWILGYGLNLISCEAISDHGLEVITSGANIFTGAGKRIDVAMKTRGFVQSLLFAEIKTHETPLLATSPYRPPDVYQPSKELTGAVAQVQKTTHKAVAKLQALHRIHDPTGTFQFEVATVRPRQIAIVGNLAQFADGDGGDVNSEMISSFELYRRGISDVEILTYDELLERARYIVLSGE